MVYCVTHGCVWQTWNLSAMLGGCGIVCWGIGVVVWDLGPRPKLQQGVFFASMQARGIRHNDAGSVNLNHNKHTELLQEAVRSKSRSGCYRFVLAAVWQY